MNPIEIDPLPRVPLVILGTMSHLWHIVVELDISSSRRNFPDGGAENDRVFKWSLENLVSQRSAPIAAPWA